MSLEAGSWSVHQTTGSSFSLTGEQVFNLHTIVLVIILREDGWFQNHKRVLVNILGEHANVLN